MKIPATFTAKIVDTETGLEESVLVRFSPVFGLSLPLYLLDSLERRGLLPPRGVVKRIRLVRGSSPWFTFFKHASLGPDFEVLVSR